MKKIAILLSLMVTIISFQAYAHGGHEHHGDETAPSINEAASVAYQEAHNTGTLKDFAKLHPMIVHFPIVLLILAFVLQLITLFVRKEDLSWVVVGLVTLGFIGAVLATYTGFHGGDPDLSTLSEIERTTFERHDRFAHLTVLFSGIAVVLKWLSQLVFKRKLWAEIITVLVMFGTVYTLHNTGENGARLVHIDAIGVQGNKVE